MQPLIPTDQAASCFLRWSPIRCYSLAQPSEEERQQPIPQPSGLVNDSGSRQTHPKLLANGRERTKANAECQGEHSGDGFSPEHNQRLSVAS